MATSISTITLPPTANPSSNTSPQPPKTAEITTLLLTAGLPPSQILLPSTPAYEARQTSFWSATCHATLTPLAIVQPHTPAQVSLTLKTLTASNTPFAIRSGGHMARPGSNNITDGVTIDLGEMKHVVYDEETEIVRIGPGGHWKDVYAVLDGYGRAVVGGREGNVGVGGFLLGGGNSFFTARRGWGCDNVVGYEVVLGDGRVVDVDGRPEGEYGDLFRVLKGAGSGNFGIVTEFRMTTFPCGRVWGGMSFSKKEYMSDAIAALNRFGDRVEEDVDAHLVCVIGHVPDMKENVVGSLVCHGAGAENGGKAFEEWLKIPRLVDMYKLTTVKEMAFDYLYPSGFHTTWFTLTFKNDPRILTYASDLHNQLVADVTEFIPEQDFYTHCIFQPIPKFYSKISSTATGGPHNVLGLDKSLTQNSILFLAMTMVKTPEQHAFAHPKVKKWTEEVKKFAASLDGSGEDGNEKPGGWQYLNYADDSQDDLFDNYGEENVKLIREAAKKYDPSGVFHRLCPGGFKIPVD